MKRSLGLLLALLLSAQTSQAQFVQSAAALAAPKAGVALPAGLALPQVAAPGLLSPLYAPNLNLGLPLPAAPLAAPKVSAPAKAQAPRALLKEAPIPASPLGDAGTARAENGQRAATVLEQLQQVQAPAAEAASPERIEQLYNGGVKPEASAAEALEAPEVEEGLPLGWVRKEQAKSRSVDSRTARLQRKAQSRGFSRAALNPEVLKRHNAHYTHEVPVGEVTDQKSSGRCWIFAGLNMIRSMMLAEGRIGKDFEFSQNYLYFFSQLEQSNRYLEQVMKAAYEPGSVKHIPRDLQMIAPSVEDGGHFEYLQFLVGKYGLVPKSAMPETKSSGATDGLDGELNYSLGITVRELLEDARALENGRGPSRAREIRERGMDRVWKILAAHLGTPPERVSHPVKGRKRSFTPQRFAKDFAGYRLDDYVHVTAYPYEKQGVAGEEDDSSIGAATRGHRARNVKALNVSLDRLERLALAALEGGQPVDIFASMKRDISGKTGIMHPAVFDRAAVYGWSAEQEREKLTRAQGVSLGLNGPDHLMMLTGFDRPDPEKPVVKFKVENSWGPKIGDHGVFHMYREWFRQNLFGIVVHKSFLSKAERKAWEAAKKNAD
ncbi:MAG TPA: hypothetical protein DCM05_02455 [Elusimicrobia bacterium]|nr:hypothetical protein [Elusimicrobiota bacterium]